MLKSILELPHRGSGIHMFMFGQAPTLVQSLRVLRSFNVQDVASSITIVLRFKSYGRQQTSMQRPMLADTKKS